MSLLLLLGSHVGSSNCWPWGRMKRMNGVSAAAAGCQPFLLSLSDLSNDLSTHPTSSSHTHTQCTAMQSNVTQIPCIRLALLFICNPRPSVVLMLLKLSFFICNWIFPAFPLPLFEIPACRNFITVPMQVRERFEIHSKPDSSQAENDT